MACVKQFGSDVVVNWRTGIRRVTLSALFLGATFFTAVSANADPLPTPINASDYQSFDEKRAALGQVLFYDKILSGNRNIGHHKLLCGIPECLKAGRGT